MATDYRNTTGLGLFDRPADDKALRSLLNPPAIPGLTESLTALNPAEWRTLLSRLKRARLLGGKPRTTRGNWTLIPLFVNFLANSRVADEPRLSKKGNRRLYDHCRADPHTFGLH